MNQVETEITLKKIDLLTKACRMYREATFQSHSGHWDKTMQHGLGCEECIRAHKLREQADKMFHDAMTFPGGDANKG